MTVRQSILQSVYPLIMKAGKIFGLKSEVISNISNVAPLSSFYDLTVTAINGTEIEFKAFKGINVLIVNTASDCGYTNQFNDLEKLQQSYKKDLVIIGFPANDFKEQEKLSDKDIAQFCSVNFGVTFLLAKKSIVIKTKEQNKVFEWLTDKQKNGWNTTPPEWNFSKYLVNKNGILTHYFGSGVPPLGDDLTKALV